LKSPQTEKALAIKELELEREICARLCRKSLKHFVITFWPIIEPGVKFIDGWHIDAICEHLEACTDFRINKLVINIPPRHMKSILVSVLWPAWVWLKYPERRFLFTSYSGQLSIRDGVKMRAILECDLYQELFEPSWTLRDDQNQKIKFENTATGFRFSTSVGGTVTGEGADYIVTDDPLNAVDATSEPIREAANEFVSKTLATRANNPKRHCRIVIMQRLHEDDATGRVLSAKGEQWDRLILPARFEEKHEFLSKTTLGFKDPRTKEGEPLWPERFGEKELQELEATLEGDSHAQLQQSPKPKGGSLFERNWWKRYLAPSNAVLETTMFVDCAQKPGISNDFTVIATWVRSHNGFYLIDLVREKTTAPLLEALVKERAATHKPDAIVIEDKSAGSSLIQTLLAETTLPVIAYDPGQRDKEVRATAATPTVKAGKCFLPEQADWVEDFIKEHEKFPRVKHDDQVDTTSMMVEYWVKIAPAEPRIRSI
jgi:predicted phage terminase large subunit-like protein